MNTADVLQTASWRGIQFGFVEWAEKVMPKGKIDDVPNSSLSYINNLGVYPRIYTIKGIIDNRNGDFLERKRAFLNACEDGSEGTFIHPTRGSMRGSTMGMGLSISESINSIDSISFSFSIREIKNNDLPVRAKSNPSRINQLKKEAFQSVLADMSNNYKLSNTFSYSASLEQNKVVINDVNKSVLRGVDKLDDNSKFAISFSNFSKNLPQIISNGSSLGGAYNDLFTQLEKVAETGETAIAIFKSLFSYKKNRRYKKYNTFGAIQDEKNFLEIEKNINSYALILAYNSVRRLTIQNNIQLADIRILLENQYAFLVDNFFVGRDFLLKINEIRNEVRLLLDNLQFQVAKVIDIKLNSNQPLLMLVYNNYGNLDKLDNIIALNGAKKIYNGNIRILSND